MYICLEVVYINTCIYGGFFVPTYVKVNRPTIVEGGAKAPFSIATTSITGTSQ